MVTVDPNEVMKVVAGAFQKAADTLKAHFDNKDPVLLTEETARKIWDAAIKKQQALIDPVEYRSLPDFETFYKQLINQ